jgi:outer membrane protein assembly factor BamB
LDGSQRWAYRTGEELGSRPVVANGSVYVASFNDSVYAVDEETGAWKWQYRRETSSEFTIRGVAAPVVEGNRLFIGFSDGAALCLDASDGSVKWTHQLSQSPQFPDVDADAQLDGQGNVIFASYASGIFSLDEATGTIKWGTSTKGITSLLLSNDMLYASGDGEVTARFVNNGAEIWHFKLHDGFAGPITVVGQYLVIPATHALLFLERKSGRQHRSFNPGRGISAPPGVKGTEIFVVSNFGYLYALTIARPSPI